MADWTFVKVISYEQFFAEHLNMVDTYYDTIYNMLWDDIIFTDFYIPIWMKLFNVQKHLYLKKQNVSI